MSAPLQGSNTKVTIGYGAGGGDALEFFLEQGQTSDTGFIKLFVCTEHVDMSWIPQESPFERSERKARKKTAQCSTWDTQTATVRVFRNG
jgi:hypothetical protein